MTTGEQPHESESYFTSNMLEPFLSGAVFGAALTAAGLCEPSVILSQMELQNWHMVQTFLTASGTSTLVVTLFQKLGYLNLRPRQFSSLGLLGPLDGNIIGGGLLGIGMTLSGACPGTLFAQLGTGISASLYTLGGAVLGSIIWSTFLRSALESLRAKHENPDAPQNLDDLTIHGLLGMSEIVAVTGIVGLFAGCVAAIEALGLAKTSGLVGPIPGGLLVAGAQLFSVLVRRTLLGTTTSFEEFGDYIAWTIRCGGGEWKPGSYKTLVVVTGIMAGSLGLSFAAPLPQAPSITIETARLVLGGVLLVLGSMIGGGCTSGHGISGISLMSVSSFVNVAAIFVGAIGTAFLI
ncbi:hypothetical protein GGS21DRAFT_490173 [Xylaria nigripes]|nr:hypothetical protein GGS21DRAFT_490173 [Xylaria nigripes]